MNENDFIMRYLQPSDNRLDRTFIHPLPPIEELTKSGDFIVQGEHDETFSTNIISKYMSENLGIRLVEVYKNTQHKGTGVFVRLVGTMSLVKTGYPFLFLDAAVTNISPVTGEREELTTRVAIHLPQANPEQRDLFFNAVTEKAKESGVSYRNLDRDTLPDFWGSIWLAESKGFAPDMIWHLRDYAWVSYKLLIEETKVKSPFDYKPMQEMMIFNNAGAEHLMFKKMGLSVPTEAQAAFFSVIVGAGSIW
ncbi:MAG: hypothetical protein JRE20_01995 [Deltaproteobacteria bacterium]|nr:hypothetical protein [Deltaproteobacteria bacterium]